MNTTISHAFNYPCTANRRFDDSNISGSRAVFWVLLLTLVTMLVEIIAGTVFHSIALLADGWHMSSHAFAMGITLFAYWASRRYAHNDHFAFGTWKIEVLAGFVSAILLLLVAFGMAYESVERLFSPQKIAFNQALIVACVGLVVNVLSVWLLNDSHHHTHDHAHEHDHQDHEHGAHHHAHEHSHQGHDLNLRAAYIHVLADALTSICAILALLAGKFLGWNWLDAIMGIIGGVLVGRWAYGLLVSSGKILLDAEMGDHFSRSVARTLQEQGLWQDVVDFHLWRVGKNQYACMLTTAQPAEEKILMLLAKNHPNVHLTVARRAVA